MASPAFRLNRETLEEAPDVGPPFDWLASGEDVLARATRGMSVLLTQDCELDKAKQKVLLTFARIRVLDKKSDNAIRNMRNRNEYRAFYLAPQANEPTLQEAYVDFASLTTIRLHSLLLEDGLHVKDRYLSMHPDVRDAMREDFIDYMAVDRAEGDE